MNVYIHKNTDALEVARLLEAAFQNGGPRIYVLRNASDAAFIARPASAASGKQAIASAFKTEQVWQRRKFGRDYRFVKIGEGS